MDFWKAARQRMPRAVEVFEGPAPGRRLVSLAGQAPLDLPEAPSDDLVDVLNGVAGFDLRNSGWGRSAGRHPAMQTLEYRPERDGYGSTETLEYRGGADPRIPKIMLVAD